MQILNKAARTLDRADEAFEAGRDTLTAQTVLNVALTVGVVVALILATTALVRVGE